MLLQVDIEIEKPKQDVWRLITDIENCAGFISGIEKVEILEKPATGITGLKWKETRTVFGKTAQETMWITGAVENQFYETRAESHGSIYKSRMALESAGESTRLSMTFEGIPQSSGAKIMWLLTGFLFKGATKKLLQQDLVDIKKFLERPGLESAAAGQ